MENEMEEELMMDLMMEEEVMMGMKRCNAVRSARCTGEEAKLIFFTIW